MLRIHHVLASCVYSFVIIIASAADAGILAVHPSAYNNGSGPSGGAWRGTSPFVNDGLNGTVDWAVFTRASFDAAFPGNGYVSPANQLVYAHQIITAGPVVGSTGMDIGLAGNPAGNGGSYSISGIPFTEVPAIAAFTDPNLASWVLATETDPLTPSEGLVYSSPNVPQLTGIPDLVDGGLSASGELPIGIPSDSPVPEPAAAIMASVGTLLLFGCRRGGRSLVS
jgi:hypothetical protein